MFWVWPVEPWVEVAMPKTPVAPSVLVVVTCAALEVSMMTTSLIVTAVVTTVDLVMVEALLPVAARTKPVVAEALPVTCRVAPVDDGAVAMPNLVLVVSATTRLDVPAAFWTLKAVVESVWFLKVVAPPLAMVSTSLAVAVVSVTSSRLPEPADWIDRPPVAVVARLSRVRM